MFDLQFQFQSQSQSQSQLQTLSGVKGEDRLTNGQVVQDGEESGGVYAMESLCSWWKFEIFIDGNWWMAGHMRIKLGICAKILCDATIPCHYKQYPARGILGTGT
jgi:hypothetical protein